MSRDSSFFIASSSDEVLEWYINTGGGFERHQLLNLEEDDCQIFEIVKASSLDMTDDGKWVALIATVEGTEAFITMVLKFISTSNRWEVVEKRDITYQVNEVLLTDDHQKLIAGYRNGSIGFY